MPTRDPIARIAQNLFTMQRIGNTITVQTEPLWQELFDQIVADLARIDPTAPGAERWRRYRTEQLIAEVGQRVDETRAEWLRTVRPMLAQTGRQQGQFASDVLVFSLGGAGSVAATPITQARVRAILTTDPFHGRPLAEWADSLAASTRNNVVQQIRLGMVNEEGLPEITRRIRGTQRGFIRQDPGTGQFVGRGARGAVVRPRYAGGVLSTTTRNAESIARTAVNHISNVAQMETYRANARVVSGVQFSATLDNATTPICASLDGTVWELNSPSIQQPPLHVGCRSHLTPAVDWEGVGLEPPDEGLRAARDMLVDADGNVTPGKTVRVRSSTTYDQWFRDQPAAVQDSVVGPARGRLFRGGQIGSFRELVNSDGRLIPLSQLRAA